LEDFSTIKSSLLKNVHAVALVSFLYYYISCVAVDLFNSINDNGEFLLIESLEHKGLKQPVLKSLFLLLILCHYLRLEVSLLVKLSVYLSTHSLTLSLDVFLFWLNLLHFIITFLGRSVMTLVKIKSLFAILDFLFQVD
jgi:hypothetical protein